MVPGAVHYGKIRNAMQSHFLLPPTPATSVANRGTRQCRRPVSTLVASGAPDIKILLFQTEHKFWRLQIDTVDVQIVGVLHFCAVEFAAANEQMDEAVEERKLRLP